MHRDQDVPLLPSFSVKAECLLGRDLDRGEDFLLQVLHSSAGTWILHSVIQA